MVLKAKLARGNLHRALQSGSAPTAATTAALTAWMSCDAYRMNGGEYRANRYSFMGGSSSGYAGKQAIVSRYPPGAQVICYVDPTDPTQAVLERGFTPIMLLGLLPLLFIAAGLFGLVSFGARPADYPFAAVPIGAGFLSSGLLCRRSMKTPPAPLSC